MSAMNHWLQRIEHVHTTGCLNCPRTDAVADPATIIAVGIGFAAVTRDGVMIYLEDQDRPVGEWAEVGHFNSSAAYEPNHDWRIILNGPLRGRAYQWQGDNWYLVEQNNGFA